MLLFDMAQVRVIVEDERHSTKWGNRQCRVGYPWNMIQFFKSLAWWTEINFLKDLIRKAIDEGGYTFGITKYRKRDIKFGRKRVISEIKQSPQSRQGFLLSESGFKFNLSVRLTQQNFGNIEWKFGHTKVTIALFPPRPTLWRKNIVH